MGYITQRRYKPSTKPRSKPTKDEGIPQGAVIRIYDYEKRTPDDEPTRTKGYTECLLLMKDVDKTMEKRERLNEAENGALAIKIEHRLALESYVMRARRDEKFP